MPNRRPGKRLHHLNQGIENQRDFELVKSARSMTTVLRRCSMVPRRCSKHTSLHPAQLNLPNLTTPQPRRTSLLQLHPLTITMNQIGSQILMMMTLTPLQNSKARTLIRRPSSNYSRPTVFRRGIKSPRFANTSAMNGTTLHQYHGGISVGTRTT